MPTSSPIKCGAKRARHFGRLLPRRSPISKSTDRRQPEFRTQTAGNDLMYIDGFVAAVPEENRQAYVDHVCEALSLFKDHGATRMVENWGDDVPVGKVTDFHRSVQRRDGEAVLFSWREWPSR